MSLKDEVQTILNKYVDNCEALNAELQKVTVNPTYSGAFRKEKSDEILLHQNQLDVNYRNKIRELFQSNVDEIRDKRITTSDFQFRLSNALTFIQAMRGDLDDKTAFSLVMPFFGDYPTMSRLLSLLKFPKDEITATNYALTGYETMINHLTKLCKICVSLVDHFIFGSVEMVILNDLFLNNWEIYEDDLEQLNKMYMASESDIDTVITDFFNYTEQTFGRTPLNMKTKEQLAEQDEAWHSGFDNPYDNVQKWDKARKLKIKS
jgi:hypothetical protein